MNIHYSETASQLMEQFYIPLFIYDKSDWEWDFNHKESEILKDVFPVMEELQTIFSPYKEKIEQYYLMGYGYSLLHSCFMEMEEEGLAAQTPEDVHAYCLGLTEEKIQGHLTALLNTEVEHMSKESDFWERLDNSSAKPETKWHFMAFYRHAVESMAELVALSRELIPLYQPFLERGAKERKAYADSFSLEDLLTNSPNLVTYDWKWQEDSEVEIYILSPWLIRFMNYSSDSQKIDKQWFVVSCRVDQLLLSTKELDTDTFTSILKTLSDATRYNVLVELTKPHAKSKDIAEALDITGAAVSFHTQKLINAQLLLFNREDKNIKYDVNKELLQEVMMKLQEDFQLGNS